MKKTLRAFAAIVAMSALPTMAMAQQSVEQTATGEIIAEPTARAGWSNMGLSGQQVIMLQRAINDLEGCFAGPVDGVIGPMTRAGMVCARHVLDVESRNVNDLIAALGLQFTAQQGGWEVPDQALYTPANQSQSGVVNAETGESTLGPNTRHVRPTGVRGTAGDRSAYPESEKNQTQSGMMDAQEGASTLGPDVKQAQPTGIRGTAGDSAAADSAATKPNR